MTSTLPSDLKHVYFIGIAGIGMSALARYFMHEGIKVSGYDRDRSALAIALESEGAEIHYEIDVALIPDVIDLVVYTPAVRQDHAELDELKARGLPVRKRSEVLGMISREKKCIAVAGTHGKTTTSAMIAFMLRQCGIDCTAILGGIVADFGGNFVHGESDWIVVEADEFDRSFLQLEPDIAVITSIDPDHLDVYGTMDEMVDAYLEFTGKVNDIIVFHSDLPSAPQLFPKFGESMAELVKQGVVMMPYGTDEGSSAFHAVNIVYGDGHVAFDYKDVVNSAFAVKLGMPGRHNINNAVAALTVGLLIGRSDRYSDGCDPACCAAALSRFKGIKRRFEIVYKSDSLTVIDDYAHHPKEVEAAVEAAKSLYRGKRITGVFQPHLYSRTQDFYMEFADALSELEEVVVVELYPARELPIEGVSSELIFNEIESQGKYLATKSELTDLLRSLDPEVLLFLGAGDLDRMIKEIVDEIIK